MHLPFVQVATDLIDHAPDLAVELDLPEERVGWGLIRLIRWGLSRCPDDAPPSRNSVVKGPNAAKLIARAAGIPPELAEAFVDACARIQPKPVLERVKDGIRIRGLDRYDEAWINAQSRSEKARTAARARWAEKGDRALSNAQALPEHPNPDAPRCLEVEVDGEVDQKPPPPPAGELRVVPDDAPPTDAETAAQGSPEEFWSFAQKARGEVLPDAVAEKPPDGYAAWAAKSIAEVGTYRLSCAYWNFLGDQHFQAKSCPFRMFMSEKVWRHRAHDPPPVRQRL